MDCLLSPRQLQSLSPLSATGQDQINRYLRSLHTRSYASGTLRVVVSVINRFLRSLPATRLNCVSQSFTQVTAADIDLLIAAAQTKKLAPSTINNSVHMLRGFFEFLREEGEMLTQPIIKHRHSVLASTTLPKPMAEADLVAFFKAIDTLRDRLIFLLMLRCGLRISEVCALTWQTVDLSQGTLLIRNGKGQVDRTAYLAPDVERALKLWQLQPTQSRYLFPGQLPQMAPVSCKTVSRLMAKYLGQAGITKHYSPHCLRHTFATQLLNAGVSLEVLKELMGHRSLQMTLCYTQLYESTKRRQYDQAMAQIEQRQANLGR